MIRPFLFCLEVYTTADKKNQIKRFGQLEFNSESTLPPQYHACKLIGGKPYSGLQVLLDIPTTTLILSGASNVPNVKAQRSDHDQTDKGLR